MSQLSYQLKLVARGLRRDRRYSSVMIVGLALSVSLLVTGLVAYRRFNSSSVVRLPGVYRVQPRHNPLQPFYERGPSSEFASFGSFGVSARVERAVADSDLPAAHTTSFTAAMEGAPAPQTAEPIAARFCHTDLFPMFSVAFRFGAPWPKETTGGHTNDVTVLSAALNERWFQGADSTGRVVIVEGRPLTIVGVLAVPATALQIWDFNPLPDTGELLLPVALTETLRPMPAVMYPPSHPADWPTLIAGSQRFMESWVALPDETARARFAAFVAGLDPDLELVSADSLIAQLLQNPPQYAVFAIFTAVLVFASVLNAVRLLFARALARSAELGIHRALGASRGALFMRHLIEDLVVVVTGTTLGAVLAIPVLRVFDTLIPDLPSRLVLDPASVAIAWCFCLVIGVVAGLYPAARVAFTLPTRYLGKV